MYTEHDRSGSGTDLACRLVAQDIENMVILGDPAEVLY